MDKKLTLNQAWSKCLRMYKWVAANWKEDDDVEDLKQQWMDLHESEDICENCYFCEYGNQFATEEDVNCVHCPGILVNPSFHCTDESYNWEFDPKAFYKKILALNEKRKKK